MAAAGHEKRIKFRYPRGRALGSVSFGGASLSRFCRGDGSGVTRPGAQRSSVADHLPWRH